MTNLTYYREQERREATIRDLAAELLILEEFHNVRRALGHDYGCGQRHAELVRRRRELCDLAAVSLSELERLCDELAPVELEVALDRVGRRRLSRLELEAYRSSTPATVRTVRAWRNVRARYGAERVSS